MTVCENESCRRVRERELPTHAAFSVAGGLLLQRVRIGGCVSDKSVDLYPLKAYAPPQGDA